MSTGPMETGITAVTAPTDQPSTPPAIPDSPSPVTAHRCSPISEEEDKHSHSIPDPEKSQAPSPEQVKRGSPEACATHLSGSRAGPGGRPTSPQAQKEEEAALQAGGLYASHHPNQPPASRAGSPVSSHPVYCSLSPRVEDPMGANYAAPTPPQDRAQRAYTPASDLDSEIRHSHVDTEMDFGTENGSTLVADEKAEPDDPRVGGREKLAQKNPAPMDHPSITLGGPIIILFDIVVPCIIYYVWYDINVSNWEAGGRHGPKPEYNDKILGYAIISFGFGELYILIARVYRLVVFRDLCAPLLSRSKWELDATSWVYAVAMLMALIPFVIGSVREIPRLYLSGPGFLMAFLGALMLFTLIPWSPMPIGINSHARGGKLRPFIYYAAEDFIAVDGLQDREFRERFNRRYDESKSFRRMFTYLTLWWILGVCIYLGASEAVIWTLEFHYAFGTMLGILFSYILIWAVVSYYFVMWSMKRQEKLPRNA